MHLYICVLCTQRCKDRNMAAKDLSAAKQNKQTKKNNNEVIPTTKAFALKHKN